MEQELLTLSEHLSSPPVLVGSCYSIFSFICMFCRSLFVLLYFYFWPLCCLSFFDIWILYLWYLKFFLKPIRNMVKFGYIPSNVVMEVAGFSFLLLTRYRSIFRTIAYLSLPKFTISSFYMFFKLSQTNNICVYNVYR